MLYLQHDQIHLLLWESVISEGQVEVTSRLSGFERNWLFITLILLTLFFFSLMVLNYRFGEYAQKLCDGESCVGYSDEAIEKRAMRLFAYFIVSFVSFLAVYMFRTRKRHQRLRYERQVIRQLLSDFSVCKKHA